MRHAKTYSNIVFPSIVFAAAILLTAFLATAIALFASLGRTGTASTGLVVATNVAFALTGAMTSLAVLAAFARFARRWTGRAWASLDRNAFGIYLLHYAFAAWIQYLLLDVPWPGFAKGLVAIAGAIAASWLTTALLCRIPLVDRVIGRANAGSDPACPDGVRPAPASSGKWA